MTQIIWHEALIKLKDLVEYSINPRRISKDSFGRLVRRLQEEGYHNRIKVDIDNVIIGGHQRKKALKEVGYKDNDLIAVLKPNRKLTDQEFTDQNISDNGEYGEFDLDLLSAFHDPDYLKELGVPKNLFKDLELSEEPEEERNENNNSKHKFTLEIQFGDEISLNDAYDKLSQEGYNCIRSS